MISSEPFFMKFHRIIHTKQTLTFLQDLFFLSHRLTQQYEEEEEKDRSNTIYGGKFTSAERNIIIINGGITFSKGKFWNFEENFCNVKATLLKTPRYGQDSNRRSAAQEYNFIGNFEPNITYDNCEQFFSHKSTIMESIYPTKLIRMII